MSWCFVCSRMKPSTWKCLPRSLDLPLNSLRVSSISPTNPDSRIWSSLMVPPSSYLSSESCVWSSFYHPNASLRALNPRCDKGRPQLVRAQWRAGGCLEAVHSHPPPVGEGEGIATCMLMCTNACSWMILLISIRSSQSCTHSAAAVRKQRTTWSLPMATRGPRATPGRSIRRPSSKLIRPLSVVVIGGCVAVQFSSQ